MLPIYKMNFIMFFLGFLGLYSCGELPPNSNSKSLEEAGNQIDNPNKPLPNILFIAVDDLRPELNCFGASQIISPNIDKLAGQSLVFNRAYCNIPTCGASRASILTGARPTRNRFVTYNTRKDTDLPNVVSLIMQFKNNGYTTISNGKIYHHANDDASAWDEIWRPKGNGQNYQLEKNKFAMDSSPLYNF